MISNPSIIPKKKKKKERGRRRKKKLPVLSSVSESLKQNIRFVTAERDG
jgi:hypothetical protein